jgi:protein-L-isoaspartate O-methyltransferase
VNWQLRAGALASVATHPTSRWRAPVATIPRHEFVPRWWQRGPDGWELHDGTADQEAWLETAYADRSLITRVGPLHADHAEPGDHPAGTPTSSATLPGLMVAMFQRARICDGHTLLDVGTGSGYGAALAAARLGSDRVTSVDVDPYLVQAAGDRLTGVGLSPRLMAVDATGPLPGQWDRIVATVGVRPIPASWLAALRPGGRLVATIAGTSLIVTADKTPDGGAQGVVEWERAGFMTTRHDDDYPPGAADLLSSAGVRSGEQVSTGPYPVVDVANAWDLAGMLELTVPGVAHSYEEANGVRTAVMAHADRSWARATARGGDRPRVHQGGPRRLWDELDRLRAYWLQHGELPVRGARVFIRPDGRTTLARGGWHVRL